MKLKLLIALKLDSVVIAMTSILFGTQLILYPLRMLTEALEKEKAGRDEEVEPVSNEE